MPTQNGIGYGDCTPQKVRDLQAIFEMQVSVAHAVIQKAPYWDGYHMIDATAGAGECPELCLKGSPVLFLEAVQSVAPAMNFRADFIEREPNNCAALQERISASYNGRVHIHQGEYQVVIPKLLQTTKTPIGLLFVDPTRLEDLHLPTLELVSRLRPRMEILLYIGATFLKRVGVAHQGKQWIRLDDVVGNIQKTHWLIREPTGREQWTFLLGSNWDQFKDYKRIGFFRLDSVRGREIWANVAYTAKERDGWDQPPFPLMQPMLNT